MGRFFGLNVSEEKHARQQADDFVYEEKTVSPSPSSPGMFPPVKHRFVRDVIFLERLPVHHGRSGRRRVNTSRYAMMVFGLRFRSAAR